MSALLANPTFWVAVALFIFIGLLYYYGVPGNLMNQLDKRGQRIADELAEAKRLRQDAEKLLKEFEAKRGAAEREAAEIVSSAKDEAERLAREAQEKIADFVKRRTASAEAKIAQAETQASAEVRSAAVDAAIKASERMLRSELTGATASSLVTQGLSDVRSKLQ
jgi:F-type H+-transporting ATPase subunit b